MFAGHQLDGSRRLEGSRFGIPHANRRYLFQRFIRPNNAATGGSRE
jgi:hypothetical protein